MKDKKPKVVSKGVDTQFSATAWGAPVNDYVHLALTEVSQQARAAICSEARNLASTIARRAIKAGPSVESVSEPTEPPRGRRAFLKDAPLKEE